jgi:hypothetical protein
MVQTNAKKNSANLHIPVSLNPIRATLIERRRVEDVPCGPPGIGAKI